MFETVIGLEVHVQLNTKTKLFSAASTQFGASPNSQVSVIDAAFPGVLPVLNRAAVDKAIQFGLAIKGKINSHNYFERKHYYYPDLPKGYQITQLAKPIVSEGKLSICHDNQEKIIEIIRVQLEEDAGKSLHDLYDEFTAIDLNRAGIPLLEIVTTPCFSTSKEVITYLKTLHELVVFLGISDGNMQEGSFRCDVNISLKLAESTTLGTRVEIKNLNSFRFIEQAILIEEKRQKSLLSQGVKILQETRLFSPEKKETFALRKKENETDYRYFPDPDLLPVKIEETYIKQLEASMPPLPVEIRSYISKLEGLNKEDILFLLSGPDAFHFFSEVKQQSVADEKTIINWLRGPYLNALHAEHKSFSQGKVSAKLLGLLLNFMVEKKITGLTAKQLFTALWINPHASEAILREQLEGIQKNQGHNLNHIKATILSVIEAHPKQIAEYRAGKDKLFSFFFGQVIKQLQGQIDPTELKTYLEELLLLEDRS